MPIQYDVKITYHVRVDARSRQAAINNALDYNYNALEQFDYDKPVANFEIHARKVRK